MGEKMSGDSNSILIVDDEAVIRDLMTDILTNEGYEVEAARNGKDALNRLQKPNDFVLLFTDIMMPEMDGIQLIREARQVTPNVIPIVMTGYATLETARAAVKEGAYDYVLKPFSLSEIKLAVNNALERYRLVSDNARLRDLTELFKISETIATIHNEGKLLDFVMRAALDRVGADRGSLMLLSEDGSELEMASSRGLPEDLNQKQVPLESSISGWVAMHSLPLCIQNIEDSPELALLSNKLDDKSFMSVPLERNIIMETQQGSFGIEQPKRQRVLAVINVNEKKGGGPFTEGDLKILSIVANHAAIALENVRLIDALQSAHISTLQSMALALEAKDNYTHGHSERVRNYAVMAAQKLGLPSKDLETIRLGAMLHDVGKIGVSDAVLNKVEKLEDEEWEQIKAHPVIGYDVLVPVGFLTEDHLALVRSHHERLDGSGYPDGLVAEEQDMRVRILAVADTYDAMSSDRAYRPGLSQKIILEELQYCRNNGKLDPIVVDLFIQLIESGEIEFFATNEP
jgi:response regulator RpfG family c-di-GMP phosphodiesterase